MKGRKKAAALAGGILSAAFAMTVFAHAAWSVSGSTWNFLTMDSYQTVIEEEYEIPQSVNPAQEISKIVNVKNTGTVDALIRVRVEKAFGERKSDGTFEEDTSLDPELIEIMFRKTHWIEKSDGYFYYQDILKAGETTKEPLFSSYRLSEKAGNDYRNKDAQIVVLMESVQAQGDAVSIWGKTYKELGIIRPEGEDGIDTAVHYLGKEDGFDITKSKTDLFASFKNLAPGCARTQKIQLFNDSSEKVELFLHAEAAGQEAMSQEQLQMVRKLLDEYGTIEITDSQKVLYQGAVSGVSATGSNMRHNISLGTINAGKEKELTVRLSLSPEMDNRYQKLTGKVKWVFSAVGENASGTWPVSVVMPPKTGDDTAIVMWFVLFIFHICLIGGICVWRRKRGRRGWQGKGR